MFKTITKQNKINFRADDGLGAFPDSTPLWLQAKRALTAFADPVPVPPIPGDYVVFLDISKWQGDIDFEVMASRGIKAVWIKADQGVWTDDRFEQNTKGALDAGLELGFYHFADPNQTSVSPEKAASHCYSLIKDTGNLSVWLDSERAGPLNPYKLLEYYVRWYEEFASLSGANKDDRLIESYTRLSFWNSAVARSDFWQKNNVGLNAARYHLGLQSPWSDGSYEPLDWPFRGVEFDEWQYSADGNGMGAYFGCSSNSVDLNVFKGSWADFEVKYNLSDDPPPPPNNGLKYARIINKSGLNFRPEPNTRNTPYFALPYGYENIEILEEIADGNNIWLRTGQKQYCAYVYQGTTYCETYEK